MNCMKCGREIPSGQVFCEDCLLDMAKYPVDPDVQVAIPQRTPTTSLRKAPKRRTLSPDEQIASLKKMVRILAVLLVLAVGIAVGLAFPAYEYLREDRFAVGQNYSSIVVTEAQEVTEEAP